MYRQILSDFGFDEGSDRDCALLLSSLAGERSGPSLDDLVARGIPTTATVCGGSASLGRQIDANPPKGFVLAADGATTPLMSAGIRPDVIVTDLDGDVEDQVRANKEGSVVFVHAHGDNADAISAFVPRFAGGVVCTCQCPPVQGVLNFGGFTDGDRAACIASSLGVRSIRLLGFDFDRPSPKHGRAPEIKARKLLWARRVLGMLLQDGVQLEPFTP